MKITEYPNQVSAGIDPANDLLLMVNLDEEANRKVTINNLLAGYGVTSSGKAIITAADASAQRTALGLVIGTNVQAYDTDLDVWATKTPPSGDVVGTTDTQTLSAKTLSSPIVTGQILAGDGLIATPSYSFSSEPGSGMYFSNSGSQIRFTTGGIGRFLVSSTGMQLPAGSGINWAPSTLGATTDTRIQRDGAGVISFRNGTTSHELNVYNTYTSSTNNEYTTTRWVSNVCEIGTVKGSAGGTARDLALITDGTQRVTVNATTGDVKINSSTSSTSPTSGALVVSGGLGVSGAIRSSSTISTPGSISSTGSNITAYSYFSFRTGGPRIYGDATTGIALRNPNDTADTSLTVGAVTASGDIEATTIATGLILKSPNGTRWRLTVSDAGASVWTSLP